MAEVQPNFVISNLKQSNILLLFIIRFEKSLIYQSFHSFLSTAFLMK